MYDWRGYAQEYKMTNPTTIGDAPTPRICDTCPFWASPGGHWGYCLRRGTRRRYSKGCDAADSCKHWTDRDVTEIEDHEWLKCDT